MADRQLIIGDRTYVFGTIPAIQAVKVEIAIAKVIGEPLFKAFTESKEADSKVIGGNILALITTNMKADEILGVMETVMEFTTCNGSRIDIDSTFTGRNKELWSVFLGGLKFNFADFLKELGSDLNLGALLKSK